MTETRGELIDRKLAAILDEDGRVPPNVIEVRSGAFVDPLDLDPELVFIEDVAFALSYCARFSGHSGTRGAEHALIVEDILDRAGLQAVMRLHGLLHDAHEAYLADLPSPLKKLPRFAFYREACYRAQARIYEGLGLPMPSEGEEFVVKDADRVSLFVEARYGLPSRGDHWLGDYKDMRAKAEQYIYNSPVRYALHDQYQLRDEFLARYEYLRGEAGL